MSVDHELADLPWLPPDRPGRAASRPAGRWWDAIAAPYQMARRARFLLSENGHGAGAVLDDPHAQTWTWFVPVGTADTWDVPGTQPYGDTNHLTLPPATWTTPPRLHWIWAPVPGAWVTNPRLLGSALAANAMPVTP